MTDTVTDEDFEQPAEEVADAFEDRKLGNPSLSWEGAKVGTSFTYTILEIEPGKGHKTTPVLKFGTNEVDRFPNGNPKTQIEILVQTDLTDYALTSLNYQEKAEEEGRPDDGIRRVFLKHPNKQEFVDTVKATGAKAPEVSATGTIKLAKRKPNPGGKPSTILAFTYAAPVLDGKDVPFNV